MLLSIRSVPNNPDNFVNHHLLPIIAEIHFVGLCENRLTSDFETLYALNGFNFYTKNTNHQGGGGVALYVKDNICCSVAHEISVTNDCFKSIFVECELKKPYMVGVIYNRLNYNIKTFNNLLEEMLGKIRLFKKLLFVRGYKC